MKLLLVKLEKTQMRMVSHIVAQNHGPRVPENSPIRKKVAEELLKRGKDCTRGERIELVVDDFSVAFRDPSSTEVTQVPLEDVLAHHVVKANFTQNRGKINVHAVVEDQGEASAQCHVITTVQTSTMDVRAAMQSATALVSGSPGRPASYRPRTASHLSVSSNSSVPGDAEGTITLNIGFGSKRFKSSLRASKHQLRKNRSSLRGAHSDMRRSRPSGDYGNTFDSFKPGPPKSGPAGGTGRAHGDAAADGGDDDLNFAVDDALFTQEDVLEDNDGDDIFGEDSEDIDSMFGFGSAIDNVAGGGSTDAAADVDDGAYEDDLHIYAIASGGLHHTAAAAAKPVAQAPADPSEDFFNPLHQAKPGALNHDGEDDDGPTYMEPVSNNPHHESDDDDDDDAGAGAGTGTGAGGDDEDDDEDDEGTEFGFGFEVEVAPPVPVRTAPPKSPFMNPKLLPTYVHSMISRGDAEDLLLSRMAMANRGGSAGVGCFLIRRSEKAAEQFTLCIINTKRTITNMRLQYNSQQRIAIPIAHKRGGPFFRTIEGLVSYYTKNRVPSMRDEHGRDFFLTSPCNNDRKTATIRKLLVEDTASSSGIYAVPSSMNIVMEEDAEPVYAADTAPEHKSKIDAMPIYATPNKPRREPAREAAKLSNRQLMEILRAREISFEEVEVRGELIELVEGTGGVPK